MPDPSVGDDPAWWRRELRLSALSRGGAWAVLGTLAPVAFLLRRVIFEGRILFERDINLVWWAQVESFVRCIAKGSWPVWDPYRSFGQPLLADPSAEILYPPTWLNLLMPSWAYYTVFAAGHLVLAAAGMRMLARRLGLSGAGAFVAGVCFVATGPVFSLVPLYHHLAGAAWIPWVVWSALRLADRPGPSSVARLAVVAAAQLLAGSADMFLMALVVVGAFGLRSALARPRSPQSPRRVLTWTVLGFALALGLAAVQWMPTLELARSSERFDLTPRTRTTWSVHPLALIEVVLPFSLNSLRALSPYLAREVYPQAYFMASLYLGLPALGLALFGLADRRPHRGVLAGLLAFALLFALGRHGVFYEPATLLLPFLRVIRYPVKVMVVAALAWALLAGRGVDALRQGSLGGAVERRVTRGFAALVAVLGAVALLAAWGPAAWQRLPLFRGVDVSAQADLLGDLGQALARAAALSVAAAVVLRFRGRLGRHAATLLAVLAVGDVLLNHADLQPTADRLVFDRRPEALSVIGEPGRARLFVYDYGMATPRQFASGFAFTKWYRLARGPAGLSPYEAQVLSVQDYLNPPTAGRWGLFGSYDLDLLRLYPPGLTLLTEFLRDVEGSPLHRKLLQMGAVTHAVALHPAPWWDGLEPLATLAGPFADPIRIFRVPSTLPRAYVVGDARVVADAQALVRLAGDDFDPRREVLLAGGSALASDPAFRGSARILDFRPDRVRLDVETNGPAYVVLVDTYGPGWRATVDARPADVLRANLTFRAVPLGPGHHVVEEVYRPPGMALGLALASTSLVALLALAVAHRERGAPGEPS
ncbi:MAG TPA: YfhO family protein [Vicinamibacteria bacterium]|nr:YfhO family protein [Vicinamibacteria bacterium]